jgi:alkylation response protein AidB-like acyl-CoA dehydrogenase
MLKVMDMTSKQYAVPPSPGRPAGRIADDAEAIAVAGALAAEFASGASVRDRERRLPYAEVEAFSRSGLGAITVPAAFGGAGVSAVTLAKVIAILAEADGSIGQIPQNHFYIVVVLRLCGSPAQQRFYFDRVLRGDRIGNALSEIGTKRNTDFRTTPLPKGDGFVLDGKKFYSTGTLFAHWIAAIAKDAEGRRVAENLDRHWRNARTHTVHDPVRWKYHAVGNYWLNGVPPPRHGAL